MNELALSAAPSGPVREADDEHLSPATIRRIRDSVPANTQRAYDYELRRFRDWCTAEGRTAVPATAETLAEFANQLADFELSPASITRALAVIQRAHRMLNVEPPSKEHSNAVLRAYRREWAERGNRVKQAPLMTVDHLRALVDACDVGDASKPRAAGVRDRAMIVLGFNLMGRRSEIANLNVADVWEEEDGLVVRVRTSKTDHDSAGVDVPIPYWSHPDICPVRRTRAWIELMRARLGAAEADSGPLFRAVDMHDHVFGEPVFGGRSTRARMTGQALEVVLARAEEAAGLEVGLTPHSLRAGGATGAHRAGADPLAIARHGRWKEGSPVLLRYIRNADKWKDNPMRGIG